MPKIVKLDMREVSGVDYPAHLANGFSIIKSANPTRTAAFLKAAGKDNAMATVKVTAKSLTDTPQDELAEIVKGLTPEQLKPIVDAINSVVEDAGDGGADDAAEGADGSLGDKKPAPFTAKEADGAEATAAAADEVNDEDKLLQKSLGSPEAVAIVKSLREEVAKAQAIAKASSDQVAVEKALRLDTQAVVISKAAYPHLGFDHEKVAPAIRKFAESDAATAKVITDLMKSLEGQAESAALFKELGTTGGGQETDAYGKIEGHAQELMKSTSGLTHSAAITKALEDHPELYVEYRKEGQ